jgi:Peptidase family M28
VRGVGLPAAIVLAAAGLLCASAAAPPTGVQTATAPKGFDSNQAWEYLRQMVAIGPRPAGSAALRETRAYITHQLATDGLTVQEQPFTAESPYGPVEMVNLIVTLPGRRTDRILVTGHYDTKLFRDQVFVGASDGASSAALLMELARALKGRSHQFTYEFIWFDGEEAFCPGWDDCGRPGSPDNTYGSRYYVQAATKAHALASIKAMILVDMIGARNLRVLRETGYSTAWLTDIIWAEAKRLGYGSVFSDQTTSVEDDHMAFAKAGVPTTDIIDLNDYPQWHNTVCCDDLDHVSAHSLQVVGDVLLASLPKIEDRLGSGLFSTD